jgi:hypothetical protein
MECPDFELACLEKIRGKIFSPGFYLLATKLATKSQQKQKWQQKFL